MGSNGTGNATGPAAGAGTPTAPGQQEREDRIAEMEARLAQIEEELDAMRTDLARLADGVTSVLERRIEEELERRLQGA